MEQYESTEKYGGKDESIERELNCTRSSIQRSRLSPMTNNDLECHESSVACE